MMTQEQMNRLVPQRLAEIEREQGVKVLCAVESGSRAWGFASPDSDFDVRFVYVRPRTDYLRLDPPRDVIETPIDDTWDVSGWDLQKALRLLYKSNPTLFEWMHSGVRYLDTGFEARLAPLAEAFFEKKAMMFHYFHLARNNMRAYLKEEKVKAKKYFYMLRPLLACMWIRDHGTPPPMQYAGLVADQLPGALRAANDRLLDLKMNSPELELIDHVAQIDGFLEAAMAELEAYMKGLPDYRPRDWAPLNRFFLEELDRAWPEEAHQ